MHIFVLTDKVGATAVKKALNDEPNKSPEEIGNTLGIKVEPWKISENAVNIEEIRKLVFSIPTEKTVSDELKIPAKDGNPEQRLLIKLDSHLPGHHQGKPQGHDGR